MLALTNQGNQYKKPNFLTANTKDAKFTTWVSSKPTFSTKNPHKFLEAKKKEKRKKN